MRIDDSLTVLLLVKDRVEFTRRWLTYASATGFPFRVYIADGGMDSAVQDMLSAPDAFPGLRLEYRRYPADASYSDFYAKLDDALSRIETPFVALADNDDFVLADALRASVQFLAGDADYAAAGGVWAWFWLTDGGVQWKASRDGSSLDADSGKGRLQALARWPGCPLYYDVRRTSQFRELFREAREANFHDIFLYEQFLAFLTVIAGKTKRFDSVYVARQANTSGSVAEAHAAAHGDWLGRLLVPTWSADFAAFLERCGRRLADRDGIPLDAARRVVIECYRMSIAPWLLADLLGEPTVEPLRMIAVAPIRRMLSRGSTHPLRQAARAVYRRLPWISPDAAIGTQIVGARVADAAPALAPIEAFLTRPFARAIP